MRKIQFLLLALLLCSFSTAQAGTFVNGGTFTNTPPTTAASIGLGTLGQQDSSNVAITGGTITGITQLTLPSTATNGLTLYNTVDQVTNFERGRLYWTGNAFSLSADNGGTGTARNIIIRTANRVFTINDTASATGFYVFGMGSSGAGVVGVSAGGTWTAAAGLQYPVQIAPTIQQTSTGGYTALLINPTETSVGSGTKRLIDAQVGSASKFYVDNAGLSVQTGSSSATQFLPTSTTAPTNGIYLAAANSIGFTTGTTLAFSINTAALATAAKGFNAGGTKFTTSGCGVVTTTGGNTAGRYTSATAGTCTVVITLNGATGSTASNGWSCWASNQTTPANLITQTASTATTATLSGTTANNDVISFGCMAY